MLVSDTFCSHMQRTDAKEIIRGGIYYVKKHFTVGSEQHSGRPAIVLSDVTTIGYTSIVVVVYLTTKSKQDRNTHVPIASSGRVSIALCEQLTTVDISRLGDFLGLVTPEEMTAVKRGIASALGLQLRTAEPFSSSEEDKARIAQLEAQLYAMERELAIQKATASTTQALYQQLISSVFPCHPSTVPPSAANEYHKGDE